LISGKTRLLALIGHPVSHSLSPAMHNAAFAADGLDFVYVCLDVDPDDLPAVVKGAAAPLSSVVSTSLCRTSGR
jgi:shikimate dehydrogenase